MDWAPAGTEVNATKPRILGPRAKWVSKAEMQKRKENGSCLRCGIMGHYVDKCSQRPPIRPAQVASTKAQDPKPAAQEEAGGISDESENE